VEVLGAIMPIRPMCLWGAHSWLIGAGRPRTGLAARTMAYVPAIRISPAPADAARSALETLRGRRLPPLFRLRRGLGRPAIGRYLPTVKGGGTTYRIVWEHTHCVFFMRAARWTAWFAVTPQ